MAQAQVLNDQLPPPAHTLPFNQGYRLIPPSAGGHSVRGGNLLYSNITETGSRYNPGYGGTGGTGTIPDIAFDDVLIPNSRLASGANTVNRIDICKVVVGIRRVATAPATDINVYVTTFTENPVGSDTELDTPPLLKVTDSGSVVSTLAGSPWIGQTVSRSLAQVTTSTTAVITLTGPVNASAPGGFDPIPGLTNLPLDMGFVPGYGALAVGVSIGNANTNNGWRLTSGPDANVDAWVEYDTEVTPAESFLFFGGSPASTFYIQVYGNVVAATSPQACCVPSTSGAVCFVADNTASCTQSGGSIVAGQTTCGTTTCATAVCCNTVTGACTLEVATTVCTGAGEVTQVGATACPPTPACAQPAAPANDECTALPATPGYGACCDTANTACTVTDPATCAGIVGSTFASGAACTSATDCTAFPVTLIPGAAALGGRTTGGTESSIGVPDCTGANGDIWYVVQLTPAQAVAGKQYAITVASLPAANGYTPEPYAVSVYEGPSCPGAASGGLICTDIADPRVTVFTVPVTASQTYFVRVGFFTRGTALFTIKVDPAVSRACCNPTNGGCVLSDVVGNCTTPGFTSPLAAGSTCSPTNPCRGVCCNNTTQVCTLVNDATHVAECENLGGTYNSTLHSCTPTSSTAAVCNPPANDDCGAAVNLTLGTTLSNQRITAATGTDITNCSGTDVDVWYTFIPPVGTHNYRIATTPTTAGDPGIAIAVFKPAAICPPIAGTESACAGAPAAGTVNEVFLTLTGSPSGQGACCTGSGCSIMTNTACNNAGGGYQGDNTVCDLPTGCTVSQTPVLIRAGSFSGNEGSFSIVVENAAATAGACCTIAAECVVVVDAADCVSPNVFQGAGATCGTSTCVAGSCCFPGSATCNVTIQSFCAGVGGTWNGADTTCFSTSCTGAVPANDTCATAFTISSPTYTSNISNEQANNEGLAAGAASCDASVVVGAEKSIWYRFPATQTGQLEIVLTNWGTYDMVLQAFTGSCATLTQVGCADETEPFDLLLDVAAGTTYFLMIADYGDPALATVTGGWNSLTTTFSQTGVCCTSTGGCSVTIQADCTSPDIWNNALTTCGTNNSSCPQPQACCLPNGTCELRLPADCTGGGVSQAGTCSPASPPCTPPNVFCCRGATCLSVPSGTCTGTVAGSASLVVSSCGPSNSYAHCCYADFNHSGASDIDDIFIFLAAWFDASPYANVGGNGTAIPDIDDIFIWLNGWFAGCNP